MMITYAIILQIPVFTNPSMEKESSKVIRSVTMVTLIVDGCSKNCTAEVGYYSLKEMFLIPAQVSSSSFYLIKF